MQPSDALRLRSNPTNPPMHIVLVEPEIPQNTGSIARLCAATQSHLHLVGTLGFRLDSHALRRAGIDYWHLVTLHRHIDMQHFRHAFPSSRCLMLSARAERSYTDASFRPGDAIVFGRESIGLPAEWLIDHESDVFGIPTMGMVRSLNLANSVSIVLYEALRQVGALEHVFRG